MNVLLKHACEAGKVAIRTCQDWTDGKESLVTSGTEFIFFHELARLLHEHREELGLVRMEFDRALAQVHARGGRESIRRTVSRNTRRLYMVLHRTCGARQVMRAQHYYSEGIVSSEAKGLVRAFLEYPTLDAAVLVGIAGWKDAINPAEFLSIRRETLLREFDGIVETDFTWFGEPETAPFIFSLLFRRHG